MKSLLVAAALASSFLLTANASQARDNHQSCGNVPIADWMSEADLRAKVSKMGIDVREVKIDDGCYEVKGRNNDGRWLEIGFHPQTGEQVWVDNDD